MLAENRLLYKYFIYGLEAHTKTSGNVRATVETEQLTVHRAAEYGAIRTLLPLNDSHAFQRYLQTLI